LPIFLLFIFGIIDLGRAVYAYHTLNSAAREAARVAVVDQTITHIEDTAIRRAMGLGLEAADITLDWRHANQPNVANSCASLLGDAEVASCTVTVRVEYEFRAATPIIGDIVGELAMAGLSSMIVEFNCQEPLPAGSPLSACPAEE
jgi:Flp pilus assembly protein TadG